MYKYRLYAEVKVSMAIIIPSDVVTRLINSIATSPRCLTSFYHETMLPSNKLCLNKSMEGYKSAHH